MKNIKRLLLYLLIGSTVFAACEDDKVDAPAASTVADFSYTTTNNAIAPATVTFTNKSVNTNYYEWDFGNGETSNAENPSVTYDSAGTYTVTLTVEAENDVYYNRLVQQKDIKIKAEPLKTLYFTDKFDAKIKYVVLDTAAPVVQEMPDISTNSNFIAIDTTNANIYISDKDAGLIKRASLDGSSSETVLSLSSTSEPGTPWGITVVEDKVYFALVNSNDEAKIARMDLDGSNFEIAVEITDYLPLDLTYNPSDQKLYFSNDGYYDDGGIWRVNTDGSGLEVVVQNHNGSPVDAAGIAIDHINGRIFYTHYADQVVVMNNLDGTNPQNVGTYTEQNLVYGVALDLENGYLYWTDRPASDGDGNGNIIRASYSFDAGQANVGAQEMWVTGDEIDIAPYGLAIDTYR